MNTSRPGKDEHRPPSPMYSWERAGERARVPGAPLAHPAPLPRPLPRVLGRGRRARRGMGLAELLIALSITAAVLTAVGAGVDASFKAYSVNQEQTRLMQSARVALHRITSQVRTTVEHQPVTASKVTDFGRGLIVTDTGIALFTEDDHELRFTYDAAGKQLRATDAAGNVRVLLRGVQSFSVKFEPMQSRTSKKTGGLYDLLFRATISLTVASESNAPDIDESVASQSITLSASIVPRRNLW
jgi:YD repeat-containing protein